MNWDRFWRHVRLQDSGCLLWIGNRSDGYGVFWLTHRHSVYAHRFLYQQTYGELAPEFDLHHRCGNRACVNLNHLQPLLHGEHTKVEGKAISCYYASRTHCEYGHPYNEENTYHRPDGGRTCKTCRRKGDKLRRGTKT